MLGPGRRMLVLTGECRLKFLTGVCWSRPANARFSASRTRGEVTTELPVWLVDLKSANVDLNPKNHKLGEIGENRGLGAVPKQIPSLLNPSSHLLVCTHGHPLFFFRFLFHFLHRPTIQNQSIIYQK